MHVDFLRRVCPANWKGGKEREITPLFFFVSPSSFYILAENRMGKPTKKGSLFQLFLVRTKERGGIFISALSAQTDTRARPQTHIARLRRRR